MTPDPDTTPAALRAVAKSIGNLAFWVTIIGLLNYVGLICGGAM